MTNIMDAYSRENIYTYIYFGMITYGHTFCACLLNNLVHFHTPLLLLNFRKWFLSVRYVRFYYIHMHIVPDTCVYICIAFRNFYYYITGCVFCLYITFVFKFSFSYRRCILLSLYF